MKPDSTILSFVDACVALPSGVQFASYYRTIDLQCWDDDLNDSRRIARVYQPHTEDPAWTIGMDGRVFRQGQCSGMSYSWIAYDAESDYL